MQDRGFEGTGERERTGQVRSAGTYHLNWPKPGIRGINAIKPDYTVPGRGGEERAALVSKKLSFPFLIGIGTVICWGGGGEILGMRTPFMPSSPIEGGGR